MAVIITPQSEIDAYFASDDKSQSDFKKILKGIDNANQEYNIDDKPNILIGKGVDTILTGEEGEFEKTFYISQIESKPSDTIVDIVTKVFEMVSEDYQEYLAVTIPVVGAVQIKHEEECLIIDNDSLEPAIEEIVPNTISEFAPHLHTYEDYIMKVCEEINYQPRYGRDAKLKAVIEPGTEYFNDLCKSFGKKIIDNSMHNTIQSVVMSLRTNPRTSKYFDRNMQDKLDNVSFIYQMPIYFEYKGIKCKALLDLVVVVRDEEGRITLIEPIDLKTMFGNTYNFLQNCKKFRYDIQGAWYTLALMDFYALDDDNVVLKPFKFIVESTTFPGKPLVYEVDKSLLKIGKEGREPLNFVGMDFTSQQDKQEFVVQDRIKGYDELIDIYLYHEENGWDREKEILEADAEERPLLIDWNGFMSVSESLIFE